MLASLGFSAYSGNGSERVIANLFPLTLILSRKGRGNILGFPADNGSLNYETPFDKLQKVTELLS